MLSPPYIASVCTLPTAKLRRLNRPSGNIGYVVRRSCTTKNASRAIPVSAGAHTSGLLQPTTGWRISASTGPARPKNVRTAPSQSTGACATPRSRPGTAIETRISVATTNGTLTAKISRQETASTRKPPASGPITVAIPDQAVHEPIAPPRSWRGKAATITANALGVSSAPKAPCTARQAIRNSMLGAIAHSNDTAPKPATPIENTRRSPNTSPSEPPTRISEPSDSKYAFDTHC